MPAKAYEAGLDQRTVVIEYDGVARAIAAHDSPAYQAALRALGDAAKRDVRIVEGLAWPPPRRAGSTRRPPLCDAGAGRQPGGRVRRRA